MNDDSTTADRPFDPARITAAGLCVFSVESLHEQLTSVDLLVAKLDKLDDDAMRAARQGGPAELVTDVARRVRSSLYDMKVVRGMLATWARCGRNDEA